MGGKGDPLSSHRTLRRKVGRNSDVFADGGRESAEVAGVNQVAVIE